MIRRRTWTCVAAVLIAAAVTATHVSRSPESLLASAKEYLAYGDNAGAVIQLKNALQKNPDIAEARFLLGKALLDSGDAVTAEKELRSAIDLKYPGEELIATISRCLVALGQNEQLLAEFGSRELSEPTARAEFLTSIGWAKLSTGDRAAAGEAFMAALSAKSDYVQAYVGQGRVWENAGDLARAVSASDKALTIDSREPDAWQLRGDLLVQQKKPELALEAYRTAVGIKSDFLAGHAAIVTLLIKRNSMEDAEAQFKEMKKAAPKHPQTYYVEAVLAYRQKNFAAAQAAIQYQLKAAPYNLPGLLLSGAIHLELKSYAQAEAHLMQALQIAPEHQFGRSTLISTYLRSGQPAKALEALKPALARIDEDSSMLALAGEVYMRNGAPHEAEGYLAKAAALDPLNPTKRTAVALSHLATGDTTRAFRELEEVASTDPGIHANLALVDAHMQRGEYDGALTAIAALEKKYPAIALPYYLRGMALLGKRDLSASRDSFERALKADPLHFAAALRLSELDFAKGHAEAARRRFDVLLAKDQRNMEALLAVASLRIRTAARAHAQDGVDPETADPAAVKLIRTAIHAHRAEIEPRLALINYYLGLKDGKSAAAVAQEAMSEIPDQPEILDVAAKAHLAAGQPNQALAIYDRLGKLIKSPQPYLRMADIQIAAKDEAAAIDSLRRALAITPDLLEAHSRMIRIHSAANRQWDALRVARIVQRQRPAEAVGYAFEGDAHAARNAWPDAIAAYRNGLTKVGSGDLAARLHNALLQVRVSEADGFGTTWLRDHPKDTVFRAYLARRAIAQRDYAMAAAYYRRIVQDEPKNASALMSLAVVAAQLKDAKAIQYAERAHSLASEQPAILETFGMLLLDAGEVARGIGMLQRASALAPQVPAIRLNLAKALVRAGQKDLARRELEGLARLGGRFKGQAEVSQLMARL